MNEDSHTPEPLLPDELLSFEIDRRVEVAEDIVIAAQEGIRLAWAETMHEPASVNIVFASEVIIATAAGEANLLSLYLASSNTVVFGLSTIQERHADLPLDISVLLLGAHEGTHKAQHDRGDPQPDSLGTLPDPDSRHEVEAWETAFRVLSRARPGCTLNLVVGTRHYKT